MFETRVICCTAPAEFVDRVVKALRFGRPDLRIREGVAKCALKKRDEVTWWLKQTWNDQYDPASEDSWLFSRHYY